MFKKVSLCLTVIAISLLAFQYFGAETVKANDSYLGHISIGKEYLVRGSYDRAIREFTSAIKAKPKSGQAYVERGTAYNQLEDYKNALADFSKAISLENKNYLAYNNRGVSNFRSGNIDGALSDFSQAIKLNEKSPFARLNFAGATLVAGKGATGAKQLESWLNSINWKGKYSGHAAVLSILGYRQSNQSAGASRMLKSALKKTNRLEWPYPALKYLDGKIKKAELLEAAKESDYDTTQAHCFIAINEFKTSPKQVKENLKWVVKFGSKNSVEYWLGKNLISNRALKEL